MSDELYELRINGMSEESAKAFTRAVPDVPELVRFEPNHKEYPYFEMEECENGDYVRYDQAAEIIAAKDANIEYHQNENMTLQICLDKTLKRAEAAEAKLAQYEMKEVE